MEEWDDDLRTLVQAFYAGDEQALAQIYEHWSPMVYTLALSSLGNVSDAEEVTQRVFTEAWTSRHTFDSTRVQLSTWLVELTRHRIAEAQAARGEDAAPETPVTTVSQTYTAMAHADLAAWLRLTDEMSRVDAIRRPVARRTWSDRLTHVRVCRRKALPPGTVGGHLRRSLRKMKKGSEVEADAY